MGSGIHVVVASSSKDVYYRIFHTVIGINRFLEVFHWCKVEVLPEPGSHIVILDENDSEAGRYREVISQGGLFASSILVTSDNCESKVRFLAGSKDDEMSLLCPSCSMFRVDVESCSQLIRVAVTYMEKNLHRAFTQDEVADYLKVSRGHLSREIKSETGCTYSEILNRLKYIRARELLSSPRAQIGQVAVQTGFSGSASFGRWFKSTSGVSPTDFQA